MPFTATGANIRRISILHALAVLRYINEGVPQGDAQSAFTMLFYLIWILVSTLVASSGSSTVGGCGVCGSSHSHTGGKDHGAYYSSYPSWFPSSGYDKSNQGGNTPGYQYYYPSSHDSGYYPPSSSAQQYPPIDKSYYGMADKTHQGYPNYQGNGLYDTGYNGYHQSWSDNGSGRYPVMTSGYGHIPYEKSNIYSRKAYKGHPGTGYYRVKKQSSESTKKKET